MVEGAAGGADILAKVCQALSGRNVEGARQLLRTHYPHRPIASPGRRYKERECVTVFMRDGFVDRYSGRRLVFPGTLRLLSSLFEVEFPFQKNWRSTDCHFAYYEMFPTINHVTPVGGRGGVDDDNNWVTTSMVMNSAKANFTLAELGWHLHPQGSLEDWDGLTRWFLDQARDNPLIRRGAYLWRWYRAVESYYSEKLNGAAMIRCAT